MLCQKCQHEPPALSHYCHILKPVESLLHACRQIQAGSRIASTMQRDSCIVILRTQLAIVCRAPRGNIAVVDDGQHVCFPTSNMLHVEVVERIYARGCGAGFITALPAQLPGLIAAASEQVTITCVQQSLVCTRRRPKCVPFGRVERTQFRQAQQNTISVIYLRKACEGVGCASTCSPP